MWNADDTSERFNPADTVKVQWTARIGQGKLWLSDMGRVLFSVTADSLGAHDGLPEAARRSNSRIRRGSSPQHARQFRHRRRQARSRPPRYRPCTFFAPCVIEQDRQIRLARHGQRRRLRRPSRRDGPARRPVQLPASARSETEPRARGGAGTRYDAAPPAADDLCRTATAEAIRGFENRRTGGGEDESAHSRPPVRRSPCHPGRRPGPASSARARPSASSTARASRPSIRFLSRRRFRRALQRPGHAARAGRGLCRHRHQDHLQRGQRHADRRRRHCGRHDTSAGACSCESNTVRFGHDTRYLHACRDNFVLEVTKHGMGKRDIVPNINFFMNVPIEPIGEMTIVDGAQQARRLCRARRRDGRALRHLQLPADQQSLQRLQPDADPRPDLGRRGLSMFSKVLIANRGEIAVADHPHAEAHGHRVGRRLFRCRPLHACRAAGRRGGAPRPGARARELSQRRCRHRRLQGDRRRGGASRLRVPVGEHRLRRAARSRGHRLHRAHARATSKPSG